MEERKKMKRVALFVCTLVIGAMFGSVGRAQTTSSVTPPALGSCTSTVKLGQVCWGADALVNLIQVNLADSTIGLNLGGGPGVLVRAWSDKAYATGVGAYLTTNLGNSLPNEVDPAVVINFATYVRVGMKWIIREQGTGQPFLKQACFLVGLGFN